MARRGRRKEEGDGEGDAAFWGGEPFMPGEERECEGDVVCCPEFDEGIQGECI